MFLLGTPHYDDINGGVGNIVTRIQKNFTVLKKGLEFLSYITYLSCIFEKKLFYAQNLTILPDSTVLKHPQHLGTGTYLPCTLLAFSHVHIPFRIQFHRQYPGTF